MPLLQVSDHVALSLALRRIKKKAKYSILLDLFVKKLNI